MTRHIVLWVMALGALQGEDTWKGVERIVAVGDVHGDYGALVEVLRSARLIDDKDNWIGGRAHFVQTGDVPDRGPDTKKIMDLLMVLEKQAAQAGGRVHCLIGNHEAMNMYGDLRYTTPAEFEAFRGADSEAMLEARWKQEARKLKPPPGAAAHAKWLSEHPPGWVEQRQQFGHQGRYGKWIRSHNTIVKINDTIFLHGGISPAYATQSLREINAGVAKELEDYAEMKPDGYVLGELGPLWYRGLAKEDPALVEFVPKMLANFGAKRIVMGHTPTGGQIVPLYGGAVVMIDVGLSKVYGSHRACLAIEGGQAFSLSGDQKLPLP